MKAQNFNAVIVAAAALLTITLQTGAQTSVTNGLIAYYPFRGSTHDDSGFRNEATIHGASLTTDRFGRPDGAFEFSGTNSYISAPIPDLPSGNAPRTLTAWVLPSKSVTNDALLTVMSYASGSAGTVFGLGIHRNQRVFSRKGYGEFVSQFSAPPNQWSFVALTFADGKIGICVNGRWAFEEGSSLATGNTGKLFIGTASADGYSPTWPPGSWDQWFAGKIDEVRVYDRSLSEAEVNEIYRSERPNLTDGLVAHYEFNGNVKDLIGGGTGSIHGNDWQYVPSRLQGREKALRLNANSVPARDVDGAYVEIPTPQGFTFNKDFTCSVWVNLATNLSFPQTVLSCGPHMACVNLWLEDSPSGNVGKDELTFIWGGGNSGWEAYSAHENREWSQVTVVRSGTSLMVYRNASVPSLNPWWPLPWPAMPTLDTETILLGRMRTLESDYFPVIGGIDGFRLYNRALSALEVTELYQFESLNSPDCVPHAATAEANILNGIVVGSTILDSGCGYSNAPLVRLVGGGGTGATAVATVEDGYVIGLTIVNAGTGYTNTPTIKIASPPFMPRLDIAVSRVKVTQHVVLGKNYFLDSSNDMREWHQVGPRFTAEDEFITQEFEVDTTGRFFRIREVP